ncbi:hypothetical protein WA1_02885 [Scytonema hofmannii PCC 7110]|uniref:Uncharacterized protein n=1 Tax=Scytonema hofmannii PCC 7110 TaxID=128403 RepID=A0A139XHF0_9CYAN|nr:hypothetical protein [Scytonema hofmannii]KYC44101.1 hypothetical protein WA1_02885 [Scytonema hofmannii PCC 7110]
MHADEVVPHADENCYIWSNLGLIGLNHRQTRPFANSEQAREALLEILDDCFEGYAIFPGSAGKRDLFNWWVVEVIPAAWSQQLPTFIYTMKLPTTLAVLGQ